MNSQGAQRRGGSSSPTDHKHPHLSPLPAPVPGHTGCACTLLSFTIMSLTILSFICLRYGTSAVCLSPYCLSPYCLSSGAVCVCVCVWLRPAPSLILNSASLSSAASLQSCTHPSPAGGVPHCLAHARKQQPMSSARILSRFPWERPWLGNRCAGSAVNISFLLLM